MTTRTELDGFLRDTFQYHQVQDFCHNGLQVEGKQEIRTIVFAVSFHLPLLEEAVQHQADAIIVHHGFFGKNFFRITGRTKKQLALLMRHDISLFGIHLPLDSHEQYGNNAQLFTYLGADILEAFDVGFIGRNRQGHSLEQMVDIFHQRLQPPAHHVTRTEYPVVSALTPKQRHGFLWYDNGPDIPEKIAIISGGAARDYRSGRIQEKQIDTFICGSIEEATAAESYETRTNFLNIGHYWSEIPGILALKDAVTAQFDVHTVFVDIQNVV